MNYLIGHRNQPAVSVYQILEENDLGGEDILHQFETADMTAGGPVIGNVQHYVPKPGENTKTPFIVYIVSLCAVVGGLLFGYDTGVVSGAMIYVKKEFDGVTDLWQGLIISITLAFAAIFSLVGGPVNDRFGRRPTVLIASALFVVGAVVLAVSPTKEVLLVGRILLGAAIGLASMTVPAYVAEVTPAHVRGPMVTCFQLMITFGFFVAGVLDGAFSYAPQKIGWRLMFGVAGVPALFQFVAFIFMPESPRFLAINGRVSEAKKVLMQISPSEGYADHELKSILETHEKTVEEQAQMGGGIILWKMLRIPAMRRALTVGCSMQMFQQLCGINTVMYYATTIIIMGGVRDPQTAIWFTCITSGVNFLCTFPGIFIIERAGRRVLLLGSMIGVMACLIVLGAGFTLIQHEAPSVTLDYNLKYYAHMLNESWPTNCTDLTKYPGCDKCSYAANCGYCYLSSNTSYGACLPRSTIEDVQDHFSGFGMCAPQDVLSNKTVTNKTPYNSTSSVIFAAGWCPTRLSWLPILGMVIYLCSFSVGFGPVPWTINSEIYPQWARSTGNSCATAVNWLFNLIISLTFLLLANAITREGAFFLYAGITAIGWVVFYLIVPETKNKELEELENLFNEPWFGKKSKRNQLGDSNPIGYDTFGETKAMNAEDKF